MPFYQSALGDRLEYELTFNDYNRKNIENIILDYNTQLELARMINPVQRPPRNPV